MKGIKRTVPYIYFGTRETDYTVNFDTRERVIAVLINTCNSAKEVDSICQPCRALIALRVLLHERAKRPRLHSWIMV